MELLAPLAFVFPPVAESDAPDPSLPERNLLLLRATPADYAIFVEHLELVALPAGLLIHAPQTAAAHVYFPQSGIISIVSGSGRSGVEASIVGRSGFLGLSVLLGGANSVHQVIAQVSGDSKRIPVEQFKALLATTPNFSGLLHRYAYAQLETVRQLAACNVLHMVEQRCARWLLMAADQVGAAPYYLTQAFLAQMLGVRRAGVATVAGELQRSGFIEYSRGRITVIDRNALEQVTCGCYRIIRGIAKRLLDAP